MRASAGWAGGAYMLLLGMYAIITIPFAPTVHQIQD
jgi:hypothetical protein